MPYVTLTVHSGIGSVKIDLADEEASTKKAVDDLIDLAVCKAKSALKTK